MTEERTTPPTEPLTTNGKVRKSQRDAEGWTRTQRRILDLLGDGLPHSREEIHGLLWDNLSDIGTIRQHISNMRKRLRPVGEEIVCELVNRRLYYRRVRLLNGVGE